MGTGLEMTHSISADEWDYYRGEVLRLSGEQSRVVQALQANTNQMAKLTETCRRLDAKIDRNFDKTRKKLDSYSDLADEAKTASLEEEVERLRSLPHRILKWAGLVLGVFAAALEVAHRIGILK